MPYQIAHLPHLKNVPAAIERWDPVHNSLFKVIFSVPAAMKGEYNLNELDILSSQIITIDGLDNLQKQIQTYKKKHLGIEVTFVKPFVESSGIEFTITFNLNLRKISDNYVFKLFKEWLDTIYNLATGMQTLKFQYMAENMTILQANRDGTIWRQVDLKNVFITNMGGLNNLDYSSSEPQNLNVTFFAEYWDEHIA